MLVSPFNLIEIMNFSERYKKLPNSELLDILNKSADYQSMAVEAAKLELNNRKLTNDELIEAEEELIDKQKIRLNKIDKIAYKIVDTLNPIQKGSYSPEKIIRLISILLAGISTVSIYEELSTLKYLPTDHLERWDLIFIENISHLLILPIIIFMFWKRKKFGWILVSLFFIFSAFIAFGEMIIIYTNQSSYIDLTLGKTRSLTSAFLLLITFVFAQWVISKQNFRELFKISKKTMRLTIGITIFSTFALLILVALI